MRISTAPTKDEAGPPLIHCIGDSHAGFFAGQDVVQPMWPRLAERNLHGVAAYRLGAFLAHSLANPRHRVRQIVNGILAGLYAPNRVLLCFGEIDCRRHIVPQAKERGSTIGRVATELANRYAETAACLRDRSDGLEFGLWGVTPTAGGAGESVRDPRYWPSGTWVERIEATRRFNAGMEKACAKFGLAFANIHDDLVMPDGTMRAQYFIDDIHLGQAAASLARRAFAKAGWIKEGESSLTMTHIDPQMIVPGALRNSPATHLPESVKAALIDRAALECARAGRRRIAIFGAGSHTRRFTLEPYRRRGLEVLAILDDHCLEPKLLGVPVLTPEKAPEGLQAVIISTDSSENALMMRARASLGPRGVEVVPVYTFASAA